MSKVLIFSGTTEGRLLAERLAGAYVPCDVCVATEYGEAVMQPSSMIKLHRGRLDEDGMRKLYEETGCRVVVDATHPYADLVTKTIKKSLQNTEIEYLRLERENTDLTAQRSYSNASECADALTSTEGNVLLTTGSKELNVFCKDESLKNRLYARVIPSVESLNICRDNGLSGRQIIAAQGPFSEETNIAAIRQYDIKHMVLKESGKEGGEDAKLSAAIKTGITAHVIKRPVSAVENIEPNEISDNKVTPFGMNMNSVIKRLSDILDLKLEEEKLKVDLTGIGCGNPKLLTRQAEELIKESQHIFGAKRMLETAVRLNSKAVLHESYRADEIIPELKSIQEKGGQRVCILFSGDVTFFSGGVKLYSELKSLSFIDVTMIPGISSLSLLCSRIGVSSQDVAIISTHGVHEEVWKKEFEVKLASSDKIFFVTSGAEDVSKIGTLIKASQKNVRIFLGYNMSYPDEKVWEAKAEECIEITENGLYAGLIKIL